MVRPDHVPAGRFWEQMMNWKRFTATASGLGTVILGALCCPSKAESADVTLHVDTVYEIDGVARIPAAVFGVTAYEGAPYPAVPQWQQVVAESGIACQAPAMSTPQIRQRS